MPMLKELFMVQPGKENGWSFDRKGQIGVKGYKGIYVVIGMITLVEHKPIY